MWGDRCVSNMTLVKCNTFPQFRKRRNMDPYPVHLALWTLVMSRFHPRIIGGCQRSVVSSGWSKTGNPFQVSAVDTYTLPSRTIMYVYTVGITPGVVDFRLLATWGTVGFYRQPRAVIPYGVSICWLDLITFRRVGFSICVRRFSVISKIMTWVSD